MDPATPQQYTARTMLRNSEWEARHERVYIYKDNNEADSQADSRRLLTLIGKHNIRIMMTIITLLVDGCVHWVLQCMQNEAPPMEDERA